MVWDHGQDDFWVYTERECRRVEDGAQIRMRLIELGPVELRDEQFLTLPYSLHGTQLCWN